MPAGTADGGKVHLGAAAHALVLRSSPWHNCGPSGIILGGLWVLGLLLWWLGLQGTGHLEGPWGRRTQASTRGASSDQGWSGVLLYVRAGPKGPGGEVPAPPVPCNRPRSWPSALAKLTLMRCNNANRRVARTGQLSRAHHADAEPE